MPEEILHYPGFERAFNQLVNDGADPCKLRSLLSPSKVFADVKAASWLPRRRSLRSVRSKANALANQISDMARHPGFPVRLIAEKKVLGEVDYSAPLLKLPEILRVYAQTLQEVPSQRRPKRASSENRRAVLRLLAYVREATGKCHYGAVAELLNAVDHAISNPGDACWDVSTLRQVTYRERLQCRSSRGNNEIVGKKVILKIDGTRKIHVAFSGFSGKTAHTEVVILKAELEKYGLEDLEVVLVDPTKDATNTQSHRRTR